MWSKTIATGPDIDRSSPDDMADPARRLKLLAMTRTRRWLIGTGVAVLLLLGGLGWFAWRLLPSDEALAARVSERFEQASGIGLRVGAAQLVAASHAGRGAARSRDRAAAADHRAPRGPAAAARRAVAPLHRHRGRRGRRRRAAAGLGARLPRPLAGGRGPRHAGRRLDPGRDPGRARAAARTSCGSTAATSRSPTTPSCASTRGWRPREAEVQRPGVSPTTRLRLEREGEEDRWRVQIDAGGGTWNGQAELQTLEQGPHAPHRRAGADATSTWARW